MLLLQAATELTFDTKIVGSLLGIIIGLLIYIHRRNETEAEKRHTEQKAQAETRHRDQLELIKKLDERQDKIEDRQNTQEFQLRTLNGIINIMQGKPYDYDKSK